MSELEIRLFGGFELRREGRELDPLPLRAARSLLAFLVLNRERPHTRDLLAGTFWPDFDESRARRRLSQALWQIQTSLRREEGERYIIGAPDTVRFNAEADFSLDVDRFNELVITAGAATDNLEETELLQKAVDLYTGDLLAGFYDDWLFPTQDELRSRLLEALERLTELAMGRGDHDAALRPARRLAHEDEFNEEAHRKVMRIAVLAGRHSEAIKQFEECRRILSEELGTEPSPETMAVYERTLADRDAGGRTLPPPEESPLFDIDTDAPFVGREQERSRLAARLDDALNAIGGVVLVEGESGVGKTRLLAEVVADATWRDMDVLWGRSAQSGGRPFAPLAEALDAGITDLRSRQLRSQLDPVWIEQLAPLIPRLGHDGEHPHEPSVRRADDRTRMYEAIAMAFRALSRINPVLVVLEDIHWADDDTVHALDQIAGRLGEERILFAVSYRHGEARERSDVWDFLRSADRLSSCERISLSPYSPAQTEELIRSSLGLAEISGEFSERLHRETGGIPLFIIEMLRALYEQDGLGEAETASEAAVPAAERLPLTPTVLALIRHRLDALTPGSRKTLELVASHDGPLLLTEIVGASELEDEAGLAAIDDLLRRRLLTHRDGAFEMGHDLMRRVVYDDLGVPRRLDLHRRIAQSVEEHRPNEVEVLAHHYGAARMPDRAAEYLQSAAERAMSVHAYDAAAVHLARLSHMLDDIDASFPQRHTAATLLEEVLDVLGRRDEQEQALSRMARFAGPDDHGDVARRRAWWLAHQDRFSEAEEQAHRALEHARAANDGGKAVAALTALGMIACFGGRAAEGVLWLEEAADWDGADLRQEADARNALGQNLIDLQRFGEAESQLLGAIDRYRKLDDARGESEVLGMLGTIRMERGEPEAAEADFKRAIDLCTRIGYVHGEGMYQMNLAILYVITNRLGKAQSAFDAAEGTFRELKNARGQALVESNAAWMWHALIGEDQIAGEKVQSALKTYENIGDDRGRAQCLALLGSISGRAGNHADALEWFEEALGLTQRVKDAWLSAQALREFAAYELEAHRFESGVDHARSALALCREHGMNDLAVGVRALLGRLLLRVGEPNEAEKMCDLAMREIRPGIELAHLVPFARSEVLRAMGEHLLADRYLDEAHELLLRTLSELPEELVALSLGAIPNHRELHTLWTERQPVTAVLEGSAPGSHKKRPVSVTVLSPDDSDIADPVERRRRKIARIVSEAEQQQALVTVAGIAGALQVSTATVRRDITALRGEGHQIVTVGSR